MERVRTPAIMAADNLRGVAVGANSRPGDVSHHSLVDWDYQPLAGFFINGQRYVSAPGALCRPFDDRVAAMANLSLKQTIAGDMRDGKVQTYYLFEDLGYATFKIWFRPQTAPYQGTPANTYYLNLETNACRIYKIVAGSPLSLAYAALSPTLVINTWHNLRLTWYTWLDANLAPILRIIFDIYQGGVWKNYITFDHQPPLFGTNPVTSIGFSMFGCKMISQTFLDDTYVYRRT